MLYITFDSFLNRILGTITIRCYKKTQGIYLELRGAMNYPVRSIHAYRYVPIGTYQITTNSIKSRSNEV